MQIAQFDPTKKKKKKKPAVVDLDDDSVDKLAEKTENLSGIEIEIAFVLLCFINSFALQGYSVSHVIVLLIERMILVSF